MNNKVRWPLILIFILLAYLLGVISATVVDVIFPKPLPTLQYEPPMATPVLTYAPTPTDNPAPRFIGPSTATPIPTYTPTPINTPTPRPIKSPTPTPIPTYKPTPTDTPKRIVGVDRDIWACYSDRPTERNDNRGCYGWHKTTVEKWRSGSTVQVWATGNEQYIRAFGELLDEQLAPVLNLEFEWVTDENDADLVAILGVSKSATLSDRWPSCPDFWGCGGKVDVKGGEVRKADLIVYHLDKYDRFLEDYPTLKRVLNGILLHEALHGLAPTGHPERSKVVLSAMRSAGYLTYIDKAILSLNSHPSIEPGMTMAQVEQMIVFNDEVVQSPVENLTAYETLDRAFAALQKVDTARMEIRGGLSGGRCDSRFGKRDWATLEIGGFDVPHDPRLAHLRDGNDRLFIFYSDEAAAVGSGGWQHWKETSNGWQLISRDELVDSTAWWVSNSKLHDTIATLLRHYDEEDIQITDQSNGTVTLMAHYNPTETSVFGLKDVARSFTVVIDQSTYRILNFEWLHRWHDRDCGDTYREEGRNIEYGAKIHIPSAIVENSEYALPKIWDDHDHRH